MGWMLVIVACLSAEPDYPPGTCRVERLDLPGVTNGTACHLAARLRFAEWLRSHDLKSVTDARCEQNDTRSAEAR